ncbi:hypothetical protein AYI69_g7391 [Smittium culicis]|uniref:Uncharacterized protein n=1 Tax=Smittium culicis TaxID=133412 RepID=A0A1R1XS78_9FUNG|nr:hypothetical protein AYI69_g7391 [Smittium culicis]
MATNFNAALHSQNLFNYNQNSDPKFWIHESKKSSNGTNEDQFSHFGSESSASPTPSPAYNTLLDSIHGRVGPKNLVEKNISDLQMQGIYNKEMNYELFSRNDSRKYIDGMSSGLNSNSFCNMYENSQNNFSALGTTNSLDSGISKKKYLASNFDEFGLFNGRNMKYDSCDFEFKRVNYENNINSRKDKPIESIWSISSNSSESPSPILQQDGRSFKSSFSPSTLSKNPNNSNHISKNESNRFENNSPKSMFNNNIGMNTILNDYSVRRNQSIFNRCNSIGSSGSAGGVIGASNNNSGNNSYSNLKNSSIANNATRSDYNEQYLSGIYTESYSNQCVDYDDRRFSSWSDTTVFDENHANQETTSYNMHSEVYSKNRPNSHTNQENLINMFGIDARPFGLDNLYATNSNDSLESSSGDSIGSYNNNYTTDDFSQECSSYYLENGPPSSDESVIFAYTDLIPKRNRNSQKNKTGKTSYKNFQDSKVYNGICPNNRRDVETDEKQQTYVIKCHKKMNSQLLDQVKALYSHKYAECLKLRNKSVEIEQMYVKSNSEKNKLGGICAPEHVVTEHNNIRTKLIDTRAVLIETTKQIQFIRRYFDLYIEQTSEV